MDRSKFSSCRDLFYNDTESRFSSCVPCGCFGEGTLSSILSCDKSNGKCYCKNHVHGQTCDLCMKGFYNARHWNIFGCNCKYMHLSRGLTRVSLHCCYSLLVRWYNLLFKRSLRPWLHESFQPRSWISAPLTVLKFRPTSLLIS